MPCRIGPKPQPSLGVIEVIHVTHFRGEASTSAPRVMAFAPQSQEGQISRLEKRLRLEEKHVLGFSKHDKEGTI